MPQKRRLLKLPIVVNWAVLFGSESPPWCNDCEVSHLAQSRYSGTKLINVLSKKKIVEGKLKIIVVSSTAQDKNQL